MFPERIRDLLEFPVSAFYTKINQKMVDRMVGQLEAANALSPEALATLHKQIIADLKVLRPYV